MTEEIKDITTAQIVDALPELGGQLTALYPEKYIFDVAGYPKVLAKDFVKLLAEQASQFQQPIHLGERVVGLEQENGHFVLVTDKNRFPSRSIVTTTGTDSNSGSSTSSGPSAHERSLEPARLR